MKQVELTSKLVLGIIGLVSVSAILIPTYAVPTIRSGDIFDGEVKTADLANGAVTNSKLANDAVTTSKIRNGEVTSDDIRDATIQEQDIADGVIPDGGGAIHIVTGDVLTVPVGEAGVAVVNCPDGEVLTGGGFQTDGEGTVEDSFPVDEDTWRSRYFNDGSLTSQIRSWAICMGPSS